MDFDESSTRAEIDAAFDAYERALVSNDVPALDGLFWDSPLTVRYGASENLVGAETIRAFRAARPGAGLAREILARHVTSFDRGFAVTAITFRRTGQNRIGRQTQAWVKLPEGWRVVSAHVSWMDAAA